MIEVKGLKKAFRGTKAIDGIDVRIEDGSIFGLIGSNGAGKSTFLRILSGILLADAGTVKVDGEQVFEQVLVKEKICLLSDLGYYFPNATAMSMKRFYEIAYPNFDGKKFDALAEQFHIEVNRKADTLSKGMKKQISVILGICTNVKYLLCDETFDGLDPVMRQAVKGLFAAEVMNREFTPIIASHNLRELEDICDHVGLMHKGGILFAKDLDDLKFHIHKIQCVFQSPQSEEQVLAGLEVLQHEKRGSLLTLVVRGTRMEVLEFIREKNPVFAEALPLSLEEIFISETEVKGYGIKDINA